MYYVYTTANTPRVVLLRLLLSLDNFGSEAAKMYGMNEIDICVLVSAKI